MTTKTKTMTAILSGKGQRMRLVPFPVNAKVISITKMEKDEVLIEYIPFPQTPTKKGAK